VRIGIVSQSYYPRYGGVTEHVHHTAVELRRRGHDVTIITSRFRENPEPEHELGVERLGYNVLVPYNRAFIDLTIGFHLKRDLRRVFERHDFEILHTHCPTAPVLPMLAVQTARCPQVGTFHSCAGRSLLLDRFHAYLERRVMRRLSARIAVSRTAEATSASYFPGDYHVIPNGVDVERFHPGVEPVARWRDPARVNVLFVGRLDPRKGVQVLLDAFPDVFARTHGRARLLVIGNSYLRPRFEAMVSPALRPHVHFMGHVPSADLPRWYATGDIFVSPATGNESFGIVLAEAMAAGRAVVASDIPGYRTVFDPGVNALGFPPGDVKALANAIVTLVEDESLRRTIALRGRERSLAFAWPRVVDRIEAVYRRVLGLEPRVTGPRIVRPQPAPIPIRRQASGL
jgi:phosphatidylinositol alpha-mannosyltransferase